MYDSLALLQNITWQAELLQQCSEKFKKFYAYVEQKLFDEFSSNVLWYGQNGQTLCFRNKSHISTQTNPINQGNPSLDRRRFSHKLPQIKFSHSSEFIVLILNII